MIATRAQKRKEPMELHEGEDDHGEIENVEKSHKKYTRKSIPKKNLDEPVEESREPEEPDNDLPFRNVPELETVPSNIPSKDTRETRFEPEKHVPAYKTRAPVEDLELDDLLDRILKADVTVKLGTLLKSVKGTRETLRKLLTSKRVPVEPKMVAKIESMSDDALKYWETYARTNDLDDLVDVKDLSAASYTVLCEASQGLPKGSVVISDPVIQYLNSLPANGKPKPVFVAQESCALRTVFPMINHKTSQESVLDQGSQIVSIAKTIADELGLTWDPEILIHMQGANGQFERSLGLAKNVPIKFGELVVYLQMHVFSNPPYKVLLGRPFDAVTRSTYKNDEYGGQVLILKCPLTNVEIEVETFERGKAPSDPKIGGQGFRDSMIWWKAGEC